MNAGKSIIFLADLIFFLRGRHLVCKRPLPFFVIWRSKRHCFGVTTGDNTYKNQTLFLIHLLMLCEVLISGILCLLFRAALVYINPSACGHLNPSSYCDVGRLFYGVFKLWSKLQRKK